MTQPVQTIASTHALLEEGYICTHSKETTNQSILGKRTAVKDRNNSPDAALLYDWGRLEFLSINLCVEIIIKSEHMKFCSQFSIKKFFNSIRGTRECQIKWNEMKKEFSLSDLSSNIKF